MSTKKRVVRIVPDVADGERLHFDDRLGGPTVMFGGVINEAPPRGLVLPDGSVPQPIQRAIMHAVFLVPEHLINDPFVRVVERYRGEAVLIHDLGFDSKEEDDADVAETPNPTANGSTPAVPD